MAITPSQFLCQHSALLLQLVLAPTMHIIHPQDISPSRDMGMLPTKDAIMNPIMQQGQPMVAEMMLSLLMDNKVIQVPGSGNLGMLLLGPGIRTLPGYIQSVVPRRPISQTLRQAPVYHHCSQRVDTLGLWGPPLSLHHSGQKMSLST